MESEGVSRGALPRVFSAFNCGSASAMIIGEFLHSEANLASVSFGYCLAVDMRIHLLVHLLAFARRLSLPKIRIVLKESQRQARENEISWLLGFCARMAGSTK